MDSGWEKLRIGTVFRWKKAEYQGHYKVVDIFGEELHLKVVKQDPEDLRSLERTYIREKENVDEYGVVIISSGYSNNFTRRAYALRTGRRTY